MLIAKNWKDFELIDTGNGEKLERWGEYILRRPDPQVIWRPTLPEKVWNRADAHYHRSKSGGGEWEYKNKMPRKWTISYDNISFFIEPTGFKHTGLFPEQAVNWDFMIDKIQHAGRDIKVLNLFAYTGGATIACSFAGAEVCHVDAAKGMVQRAKENLQLSNLQDRKVRFIVDDVFKFVQREKRRNSKYDAIIMDPPSYGRGPKGEMWKIEDLLFDLVAECADLLTENPLFFLINSYTSGFSPMVIHNILKMTNLKNQNGNLSSGEIGLKPQNTGGILPCGIYARWEG